MILHAPPSFWVIKKFQSQSNIPPPLDGNQKGWACAMILRKKKIIPLFPFWVAEESQSPSDGVGVKNKKNKRGDGRK
jgi:hypothetical protein